MYSDVDREAELPLQVLHEVRPSAYVHDSQQPGRRSRDGHPHNGAAARDAT